MVCSHDWSYCWCLSNWEVVCSLTSWSIQCSTLFVLTELNRGELVIEGTRVSIGNRNDSLIDRRRSNYSVVLKNKKIAPGKARRHPSLPFRWPSVSSDMLHNRFHSQASWYLFSLSFLFLRLTSPSNGVQADDDNGKIHILHLHLPCCRCARTLAGSENEWERSQQTCPSPSLWTSSLSSFFISIDAQKERESKCDGGRKRRISHRWVKWPAPLGLIAILASHLDNGNRH